MLYRPETFEEVLGNKSKIAFLQDHVRRGTLPNFMIISGPSGVGKTTIVKLLGMMLNCESLTKPCYTCPSCLAIRDICIRANKDTENVISRKMTTDGTKEKAEEIIALFKPSFLGGGNKVIILDEAHSMAPSVQDAVLIDTEYLDPSVFVFLVTNELKELKEAVLGRAVRLAFKPLSKTDLTKLLKIEAKRRHLIVENDDMAFNIIAAWAEMKPRAALKVLEAMGENRTIPLSSIKDYVSYLDTSVLVPLLHSLSQDYLMGITNINRMEVDTNTQRYLIEFLIEVVCVMRGSKVTQISTADAPLIREAMANIPVEIVIRLLGEIAQHPKLDKAALLGIYIKCHPKLNTIVERTSEAKDFESLALAKQSKALPTNMVTEQSRAPKLKELVAGGVLLE